MAKKYIDAEVLKAEMKRLKLEVWYKVNNRFDLGARRCLTYLESFIDSLQQEPLIGIHDIGVEGEKGADGSLVLQEMERFCRNAAEGETQVTPTQKFLEWADRLGEYRRFCKENCKGYQETGKCFCDGECDAKRKFDKHEQPSEDLEAEMGKYFDGWHDDPEYGQAVLPHTYECIGVSDCKDIARHFYELGKQAKKEE